MDIEGIDFRVYDPHVVIFKDEAGDLGAASLDSDPILVSTDHDGCKSLPLEQVGRDGAAQAAIRYPKLFGEGVTEGCRVQILPAGRR